LGNESSRVAYRAGEPLPVYLLREVEKFLNHKNISAARFGRDAMGDPRFVFDLRNGREPRARTVNRIRSFLEQAR